MEKTARDIQNLDCNLPAYCFIKVVQIHNKSIDSKQAKVRLTEVNETGVRFLTSLRLPVDERVIWRLQMTVHEITFSLEGYLVNREQHNEEYENEYDVAWKDGVELGKFVLSFFSHSYPTTIQANQSYAYWNKPVSRHRHINVLC